MKDLLVTMGASEVRGYMAEYLGQLQDAGIETNIDKLGDFPNKNGGGTLGFQIKKERELAQRFSDYEKIVFTDAWDVLFYGTKADVICKIPDDYVLLGAERNCYPDALPIAGDTPWRFTNGGLMAGSPKNILAWLDGLERHPLYRPDDINQRLYNLLLLQGSELVSIDSRTELFYCLILDNAELQFERGLPVNTLCGTHPNFIHANGKSEMRKP